MTEAATTAIEAAAPGDDGTTTSTSDATEESSDNPAVVADESTSTEEGSGDTGESNNSTVPETYADFTVPEGVDGLDKAAMERATPLFKELGLSQENAQKLVNFYASEIQAGAQNQLESFSQLKQEWREKSSKDNEFGGDKFQENVGIAMKALDKFGTPELRELMDDTGVGNHPEVIRAFYKVGQFLVEDNPGSTGSASSKPKDRVSILYPTG